MSEERISGETLAPQTTPEPGPETQSCENTALIPQRIRVADSAPRSCNGCKCKKVRCDKKQPCAPCVRAGTTCVFPPAGPRQRRTKKAMMADMAARIASLEKDLAQARNEKKAESCPDTSTRRRREDILVQKGSSSQYFNEMFLSRVLEKERNIDSILTTPPKTGPPVPPGLSPFNACGILSSPFPSFSPATLHPPKELATRLWNIYVNKVDVCPGLKLLHIPTDEIKVYSVIHDPSAAPLENLALCFAIYFVSAVSLEGPEAQLHLGQDKAAALFRFKIGFEQALALGNFLDSPTLTGLSALVMYLSALRVHNRGKGMWVLAGLGIRIAQCMGLHRDGKLFGLSPFESEIRRRLWWHLLSRETRPGEDYGIEIMHGLVLSSDVDLPVNVDDADLYADMPRLPEPRKGWTVMTSSLILVELTRLKERLDNVIISTSGSSPPSEGVRLQLVNDAKVGMEKYLERCNPLIPHQMMTGIYSRFVFRKLDFLSRLQWKLLQHTGSSEEVITEENLTEALEVLDPRLTGDDGVLHQFAWSRKAFPQYQVIMYVLWHLCVKPEGPNIDWAWKEVDELFSRDLEDEFTVGFGSKMAALVALKKKATAVRAKLHAQKRADKPPTGNVDDTPSSHIMPLESDTNAACALADITAHDCGFGTNAEEWPNWSTLVQGFQFDPADVFWQ